MSREVPRFEVQRGMQVVASDDHPIGNVADVRQSDFRVDRPRKPDVYIPYAAVRRVDAGRVVLNRLERQVVEAGWAVPEGSQAEAPLGQLPVHEGMEVVDADRKHIGAVFAARPTYLDVVRPVGPNVYPPRSAIQNVSGNHVVLNVYVPDIDAMGWSAPPMTGPGAGFTLRPGMDVYGSDQKLVGQVKELRRDDFKLDRSLAPDMYVPLSEVSQVQGDHVILNLTAEETRNLEWHEPPAPRERQPGQLPVQGGMEVVDSQGYPIGYVTLVHDRDFIVHRPDRHDLDVPDNAIRDILGNRIVLAIPDVQIELMHWDAPDSG